MVGRLPSHRSAVSTPRRRAHRRAPHHLCLPRNEQPLVTAVARPGAHRSVRLRRDSPCRYRPKSPPIRSTHHWGQRICCLSYQRQPHLHPRHRGHHRLSSSKARPPPPTSGPTTRSIEAAAYPCCGRLPTRRRPTTDALSQTFGHRCDVVPFDTGAFPRREPALERRPTPVRRIAAPARRAIGIG
jgi:hypothetical protein